MPTVAERIKTFNQDRIPVYTALKYALMAQDPFVFFRGTCHLFYEDLRTWRQIPASPLSWICGDLHLENFGSYKGDNRQVYFDLTDFDEGILAPATWELTRIITSIFLALDAPGANQARIKAAAKLFLQTYSSYLQKGKARYVEQATALGCIRDFLVKVAERRQKDLVAKRTILVKGQRLLRVDDTRLFAIDDNLKKTLLAHLTRWTKTSSNLFHRGYKVTDAGFRIAGTGSIGLSRYLFLLKKEEEEKYLLIDMKQARPSSLQPYSSVAQPAWHSEAARITSIQDRMQNVAPALLSTTFFQHQSYVIKEMQPLEDKLQFSLLRNDYEQIDQTFRDMALLTASAQLRSSGRQGAACADELIAFGENKSWQEPVLNYALQYARQVKKDWLAYLAAYKKGYFQSTS